MIFDNDNDNELFLCFKLMAQRYNIYTTIYNVHMQSKDGKYSWYQLQFGANILQVVINVLQFFYDFI